MLKESIFKLWSSNDEERRWIYSAQHHVSTNSGSVRGSTGEIRFFNFEFEDSENEKKKEETNLIMYKI